jgi:protein involved in polysaccharide export with SLBB domain
VERPGRYQLLPGENLSELAAYYGNGLTVFADTGRISLVRHTNSQSASGDLLLLTAKDVENNYELKNYDEITIPAINDRRPVATVDRIERRITLAGAVRRPGTYDLGENENLTDLIEIYGDGITPMADTSRIELVRIVNSKAESGDKLYLTQTDIAADYDLQNMDIITIPVITDLLPVMFVEGAVQTSDSEEVTAVALESSNRLTVRFNTGENYATLVQRNRAWFSAVSDTQNAYVIRDGTQIPLNLNPMLYDSSYRSEYAVETNDTLIIPFRQYFISVAGAVNTPGRYPYIPDRDWEYYIGLAGGFNPDRNSGESITIQNIDGKKLKKTDPITPETTITAQTNSFLYGFNRWAPIVTTILSIITSFLTVMAVTGAL